MMVAITDTTTQEEVALQIIMSATDVDGDDVFTYSASSDNENVTAEVSSGNLLTLTPALNFNGSAAISVTANDGTEDSNVETFTLTVSPVNDAPVLSAIADTTTQEEVAVDIILSATDVDDGDILTYSASSDNENVTPEVSGNLLTLTPALNFNGLATISVTANDGTEAVSYTHLTLPTILLV